MIVCICKSENLIIFFWLLCTKTFLNIDCTVVCLRFLLDGFIVTFIHFIYIGSDIAVFLSSVFFALYMTFVIKYVTFNNLSYFYLCLDGMRYAGRWPWENCHRPPSRSQKTFCVVFRNWQRHFPEDGIIFAVYTSSLRTLRQFRSTCLLVCYSCVISILSL